MKEAVTRILDRLDRANGLWSAVAGLATFNTVKMEADIREVLEAYETVVAERDALLKQNQAAMRVYRSLDKLDWVLGYELTDEGYAIVNSTLQLARAALVGEKEENQDAGK